MVQINIHIYYRLSYINHRVIYHDSASQIMELEVCIFPKFESCDDTLQPRTGNSQINKVTIGTMHSFACKSGEIPLFGIAVKTTFRDCSEDSSQYAFTFAIFRTKWVLNVVLPILCFKRITFVQSCEYLFFWSVSKLLNKRYGGYVP